MQKTLDYYMALSYTIELQYDPEDAWFVRIKELPGCMSQGDTPEEAIEMIQEAMELWLEVSLEDGDPIPEPRELDDYSGKFVVRVPRSLHRDLVDRADEEGVSLNQYINVALGRAAGRLEPSQATEKEDSGWPGLHAAMQRVLAAAGYTEEAGELDERLFADWADRCLAQLESALQQGYVRDALWCLAALIDGLKAGSNKSPAIAAFCRTAGLLQQQVEEMAQLRQGVINDVVMRSRIAEVAYGQNQQVAQAVIKEERVAYSRTSTERGDPRAFVEQLLGQSDYQSR